MIVKDQKAVFAASRRPGPRPVIQRELPHCQLNDHSPEPVVMDLNRTTLAMAHVGGRESRLAAPNTCALYIPDALALGPKDAFIDDHEFCHIHSGGYLHLSLPKEIREQLVQLGWGESHPSAEAGFVPATWMMLYAPRDLTELSVVLQCVEFSKCFAMGIEPEVWNA